MASVLGDDNVVVGADDDAPSPLDMDALGADALEASSDGLMIDEPVPILPTSPAALAKDVWLDTGANDIDTGSAKLCEELRPERV